MRLLLAQVFTSLRAMTITQEIHVASAEARQFAVQPREPAPTLWRVRHSGYHRQLIPRKFRNGLKSLVNGFTVARWHAHLSEFCEKRRQVVVGCLCRIENGLRNAMPFIERYQKLGDLQFPANPFFQR